MVYDAPESLKAIYGSHPAAVVLSVHFKLRGISDTRYST